MSPTKKIICPHKTRLHFSPFFKMENRYLTVKVLFLSNQNHLHPPAASSFLNISSLADSIRTTRFNIQTFYIVLALSLTFCADLRTDSDYCFRSLTHWFL